MRLRLGFTNIVHKALRAYFNNLFRAEHWRYINGNNVLKHARQFRNRKSWDAVKGVDFRKRHNEDDTVVRPRPGKYVEHETIAIELLGEDWRDVVETQTDRASWLRLCEDMAEPYLATMRRQAKAAEQAAQPNSGAGEKQTMGQYFDPV